MQTLNPVLRIEFGPPCTLSNNRANTSPHCIVMSTKEKYWEKCRLFADFSDFLGILGVSSDDLGTLSIGTRLLLGILVPDSLRKVGER